MTLRGLAIAKAAQSLVGVPFRLHGRNAETGLDCVGLVWLALNIAGHKAHAPRAYGLRNSSIEKWLPFAHSAGLCETSGPIQPGDILMVTCGPAQSHLMVAGTQDSLIHAHAGLRRVVAMPGPPPWPVMRHWRLSLRPATQTERIDQIWRL